MKPAIEWNEVKSRIQANESALQQPLALSPARVEAVFRKRAIQLAKGQSQDKSASSGSSALIFRLARERYAIELKELAEVLPFRGCTHVPGTSPEFLGVINLRGDLRPVVDLGIVLSGRPGSDSGFVLFLRRQVGLKVDDIEDFREIRPEQLAPPIPGDYTRGLLSETLKVLEIEAMLSGVLSKGV